MKTPSVLRTKTRLLAAATGLLLTGFTSVLQAQNTNPTNTFDNASSTASFVQWWGTATMTWDGTKDQANDPLSGSVEYAAPFVGNLGEQFMTHFTIANRWGWDGGFVLDATTYTNMSFDIKVNPSSGVTTNGAGYGNLELGYTGNGWSQNYLPTFTIPLSAASGWVHVDRPLNPSMPNINQVVGYFFKMWSNGSHTNTLTFNIDNVKLTKPTVAAVIPPPTVALQNISSTGLQITMDLDGQQWQRDAIVTPSGSSCFWAGGGATPVTYSFTISDFPDVTAHPDFEAHMFIVNGDTSSPGDQTYGGCDWNAADIAILTVQPGTGGVFNAQFQMKTNRPNNNPLNDVTNRPASLQTASILGTWSLTFTYNTNVTMTGPGGATTNFVIGNDAVLNNFSPASSYVQFGFHKNDGPNDGHNNGVSGTISSIQLSGGAFTANETFNGPAYDSNYAWRKTSATAVNYIPPGSTRWLSWTKPAIAYYPQVATDITGPWTDLVYTGSFQTSSKSYAALSGNAGNKYYRMIKRPFTKLQVLMPGETAAPNTLTGKTGTPTPQASGVPFNITVNACDSVWRQVSSSDTINITSTDGTATLPADAALIAGSATFTVTFNTSGNWTVTATDVTDGSKTPDTGSTTNVP